MSAVLQLAFSAAAGTQLLREYEQGTLELLTFANCIYWLVRAKRELPEELRLFAFRRYMPQERLTRQARRSLPPSPADGIMVA